MMRSPRSTTTVGAATGPGPSGAGDRGVVLMRTDGGRVLLVDREEDAGFAPEQLDLPPTLVQALSEWAGVTERVVLSGGAADAADMVSRRGRQLAARLAVETAVDVDYLDPVTGDVQRIRGEQVARGAANFRRRRAAGGSGREAAVQSEPTPWATGLAVSAIIAAIVTICLVVVSIGLAEVSLLLAAAVNIAVAAGFAPSVWLGRRVPVWRWVALGTAGGIVVAWFALLLGLLG